MKGGARPGAGRKMGARKRDGYVKPSEPATPRTYADADAYLAAVVRGEEPPDRDRIAAAKAILPYQKPKVRTPMKAGTPKEIHKAAEKDRQAIERAAWQAKKEAVRKRLAKQQI